MSEPNPQQKAISENLEGFYVVDAGPGTGKTFTIVNRYVNIIKRPDVKTSDVLLLTFTKNAAEEMEERIREKLSVTDLEKDTRLIQAGTFDSFCHSVVRESPEVVSDFLGFKERLTRGATLIENDTLNKEYFSDFFDRFNAEYGDEYGDVAIIASTVPSDVYNLINKLMSKGIVPMKRGWFGGDGGRDLLGDTDEVLSLLEKMNSDPKIRKKALEGIYKRIGEGVLYADGFPESGIEEELPQDVLDSAAFDSRSEVLKFIHDVYYEYIRSSVSDDRLTFGLNSVFAFIILYSNTGIRNRMSCRFVMIDEFQDTNENQMMIALMLLKEPNLCVVGDWKQGIYGFRFVSIENIVNFDERASVMYRYLNDDIERIQFKIPKAKKLPLNINYRSSQLVIDTSFKVLDLPGKDGETVHLDPETVVKLEEGNENIGDDTHVKYVQVPNTDQASETVSRIIDYVTGDDLVLDNGELRRPRYGDIAVICKNRNMCRKVYEDAIGRGVPAFLQGEVEIMSTREGKLLLSWLKFINNKDDSWGIVGILSDMGYSLNDVRRMTRNEDGGDLSGIKRTLLDKRSELMRKRRRVTDLISSIFTYYGLNNDITQAIISTLSSVHRSSLLTISDLIRIIETDIKNHNAYSIDADLDADAVLIQTMHKSKGLEYPIVIIPQLDSGVIPNFRTDSSVISYDETEGVRCFSEILSVDGFMRIGRSWKSELVRAAMEKDHSEDRRTLFVAISRAKQYVTMICGNKPSAFIKGLSGGEYLGTIGYKEAPLAETHKQTAERPVLKEFVPRRRAMGVHEVMNFEEGLPTEGSDEVSGKGMEYGTRVHYIAEGLARGIEPRGDDERLPEVPVIRDILDSVKDADLILAEVPCILPLDGAGVTLRGVIDLLVLYPDRAEVHDYKTDVTKNNLEAYTVQLSIYAQAVSGFYGRPTECVINFISLDEKERFVPKSVEDIETHVLEFL